MYKGRSYRKEILTILSFDIRNVNRKYSISRRGNAN